MNKHPNLKLIKKDKDGNYWYGFRELSEMSYLRSQVADVAKRFNSFKITAENLRELCEAIKSARAPEEKNKLADEIILRSNYIADEDCLLKLCSVYFILNDENPDIFDRVYDEKKIELLKNDYELKCFFLYFLQNMIELWPVTSPLDMVEYLELQKSLKDELAVLSMRLRN